MRRLSYGLLLLLVLFSCTRSLDEVGTPYISLALICDEPEMTRAGNDGEKDGVDRYNENYMDMVDFFFYPGDNPDRDADATYHVRLESRKRNSDVFRIELNSDIINNRIFPIFPVETRKVTVFALVNYHTPLVTDENDLTGTSLGELESIVVESDFVSPVNHAQTDFLMSGKSVISLRGRTQIMTASGSIDLSRYACKLTTGVKVADRVELSDGQVWTPMLDGMEIYLENGVKTVTLSGEDPEPVYFSYSANRKRFVSKDLNGHYSALVGVEEDYYNTYPMYMYPQTWTYGSTEGYDREPYLKLVLPWARLEENGYSSTEKQLYYKVVMPDDMRSGYKQKFVRNNWYHLNIDVGILGAETDEAAVPLDPCSCYIAYWQGKDVIIKNVAIGKARYLSVEQDSLILNNIGSVEVNYTTSHPVVIKNGSIRVTRPYYGTAKSGEALGGVIRKDDTGALYPKDTYYLEYDQVHREGLNQGNDWFTNTGTSIVFEHALTNDYVLQTFDYSPYTITFTIVHEDRPDDARYSKDIYIKQYPAIFIEALRNSDDTFVDTGVRQLGKQIHTSDHWGYVYVDNEQMVRPDASVASLTDYYINYWRNQGFDYPNAEEYHWRIVWYTGGGRDIFKINVTVLPPNSKFVIGDPRKLEIDNLRNDDADPSNDFHDAPALYDGETERSLKYYYPAENSSRTINMMAPSYRISTKCGGVEFDGLTFEQATIRCACYQEDGFPAGRWRLPTMGEIQFIATLSSNNIFEFLFGSGATYWSANGAVKVTQGDVSGVSNTAALSRCVYDSWYWGDDQLENREQFVWGDQPR